MNGNDKCRVSEKLCAIKTSIAICFLKPELRHLSGSFIRETAVSCPENAKAFVSSAVLLRGAWKYPKREYGEEGISENHERDNAEKRLDRHILS